MSAGKQETFIGKGMTLTGFLLHTLCDEGFRTFFISSCFGISSGRKKIGKCTGQPLEITGRGGRTCR